MKPWVNTYISGYTAAEEDCRARIEALQALNADLLAALKKSRPFTLWGGGPGTKIMQEIDAAIAKTEALK